MPNTELHETAAALVAEGKGILAADESTGTIKKRFDTIGVESTEENRRAYRDLLFTTPGAEEYISGVILYDETIRQSADDGTPFPELLASKGIIPGIKVDAGAKPLAARRGRDGDRGPRRAARAARGVPRARRALREVARDVLDHATRCRASTASGRTRTRSPATRRSARRRASSRSSSPRCCRTGRTRSSAAAFVTSRVLAAVYTELFDQRVDVERNAAQAEHGALRLRGVRAARASTRSPTRRCTRCYKHVPAAVPGIVFLSGGQSDEDATAHLNAMNARGPHPWQLSLLLRPRPAGAGAEGLGRQGRRTSRPASARTTTARR